MTCSAAPRNANAFLLVHGWTAGALLLESADKLLPACRSAKTVSQLAAETGAKEGPLAILLRCCSALGYLDFNPVSSTSACTSFLLILIFKFVWLDKR